MCRYHRRKLQLCHFSTYMDMSYGLKAATRPGGSIAETPQINIHLLEVRLLRWMSMILYRSIAESQKSRELLFST